LLLSISFSDGNLIKSTKSVAGFKKENLKLTPFEIKSESHVRGTRVTFHFPSVDL
jgi:hypothetical protein